MVYTYLGRQAAVNYKIRLEYQVMELLTTQVDQGLPGRFSRDIVYGGGNTFVAVGGGGPWSTQNVFVSTNNGASFQGYQAPILTNNESWNSVAYNGTIVM